MCTGCLGRLKARGLCGPVLTLRHQTSERLLLVSVQPSTHMSSQGPLCTLLTPLPNQGAGPGVSQPPSGAKPGTAREAAWRQ